MTFFSSFYFWSKRNLTKKSVSEKERVNTHSFIEQWTIDAVRVKRDKHLPSIGLHPFVFSLSPFVDLTFKLFFYLKACKALWKITGTVQWMKHNSVKRSRTALQHFGSYGLERKRKRNFTFVLDTFYLYSRDHFFSVCSSLTCYGTLSKFFPREGLASIQTANEFFSERSLLIFRPLSLFIFYPLFPRTSGDFWRKVFWRK